ncbi:MAG: tyrosine-type recombinase/integrase [Gemmataceae bacterium]
MDEIRAVKSAERKTPKFPSHMARNKRKRLKSPKRRPADWYLPGSYAHAVNQGVKKANDAMKAANGEDKINPIPHWHPNQLRHTHATKVRAMFGLEAAQVALGHARADVTQIYAEKNMALAAEVAVKMG